LSACESQLSVPETEPAPAVEFAKIPVVQKVSSGSGNTGIMIHLPMAAIEVHEGTSQQMVENVLLALRSVLPGGILC
jgi:hypothetical protein